MKSKGCLNPKCEANQKKIYFKDTDNFCPKCGSQLETVCQHKKCYKPIDPGDKYCYIHEAELNDKRDQCLDVLGKVGESVLCVGGLVFSILTTGKIKLPTRKG